MSDLNFDLFSRHLIDNPSCACGHPFETAEHFLLFCPNNQNERINTIIHYFWVTSPSDPVLTKLI